MGQVFGNSRILDDEQLLKPHKLCQLFWDELRTLSGILHFLRPKHFCNQAVQKQPSCIELVWLEKPGMEKGTRT